MRPADLRRLLLLSAIWGGSFIFIRVVVPALGPIAMVEARVLIAGAALLLYAGATDADLEMRYRWPQYLALGALTTAIPFVLISAAELHITASIAAILNATSPLFGAIFAALWLQEPLTSAKVVGIVIAITGVTILVGWSPITLDSVTLLSIGASLLASAFYGYGGVYTKRKVQGASPLAMSVGSQIGASLLLAPAVPFALPETFPSTTVVLCLFTLALLCTAFAYILYFRLFVDIGPTRTLTVTFLTPLFGVLWGALFLGEGVTVSKLTGCAIILCGAALVTNARSAFSARISRPPS